MIEQAAEADVKEKFEETLFLHKRVRAAQRESREPDYEDVRRIGQNLRFFKAVLPHSQFITLTQQGLHLPPALVLDYIQASVRKDSPVVQERVETPDNVASSYASLDSDTREFVQELDAEFDLVLKRTAKDLGYIVQRAKDGLPHGLYMAWIASKGMSQPTAWRMMQVAQGKELKSFKMNDLDIEVIEPPIESVEEAQECVTLRTPREVVEQFFTNFPNSKHLSNREIAKRCGVTEGTVRNYKKELFPEPESKLQTEVIPATQAMEELFPSITEIAQEAYASTLNPIDQSLYGAFAEVVAREQMQGSVITADPVETDRIVHDEEPLRNIAPNPVVDEAKEKRDTHVMQVMGSSESPEWYTPQEIVQLSIELLGKIDLDPCSNSHETPNVPAHTLFTKEDDGLSRVWEGKVYFNPPYGSEIQPWIDKLINSYGHGVTEAIALLPARIDTLWFQPLYEFPMCNIRGRLQFENASSSAPFPSVIVYLGDRIEDFIKTFQHKGPIMRRIG